MKTTKVLNTLNFRSFLRAIWWGTLIGTGVGSFSYVILLGVGTTYASINEPQILKEIKTVEAQKIASPATAPTGTINNRELSQVIEELNRTKEDLKQTKAELKTITDNISEHFISNYRDTITVIGAGIGILAALLSGLIAWGYGLVKEGLTQKIKRETEAVHKGMMGESKNQLSYVIYRNLSHAFYLYYRVILHTPDHPGFKGGTDLASWFAEGAIINALRLPEGQSRENQVNAAKLDLQYHLACKSLIPCAEVDKQNVVKATLELYELLKDTAGGKEDLLFEDTVAWVLILLGDEKQIEEGRNILRRVLENQKITVAYRAQLIENYEKIGKAVPCL